MFKHRQPEVNVYAIRPEVVAALVATLFGKELDLVTSTIREHLEDVTLEVLHKLGTTDPQVVMSSLSDSRNIPDATVSEHNAEDDESAKWFVHGDINHMVKHAVRGALEGLLRELNSKR